MMDKLQLHCNKLIRMANLNYDQSKRPEFEKMKVILLAKAEAFEDAAALFAHHFTEVKTEITMRFTEMKKAIA